jgi:hypothetical protein
MTTSYTSDQTALFAKWFQRAQLADVPLQKATAIVEADFEGSNNVSTVLHFGCKVANNGNQKGKTTKEDWKEIFTLPFDTGVLSFRDGLGFSLNVQSDADATSRFGDEKIGSTLRQLAIDLAASHPSVIPGYDPANEEVLKGTGQHAYEAAVELLGCRNPTMNTSTSASSAAAAASTTTATSTSAMLAHNDLGILANAAARGGTYIIPFLPAHTMTMTTHTLFLSVISTPDKENEATTSNETVQPPSPIEFAKWDDVVVSVDATNKLSRTVLTRLKSIGGIPSKMLQMKHLTKFCTTNGVAAMRNKPKHVVCEAIVNMKVSIYKAVLLLL